jgi:hypothetical protein
MIIILTVQSVGSRRSPNVKYRLAISKSNYRNFFSDVQVAIVILDDVEISCNLPTEQCPELYHFKIDEWIRRNRFHTYPIGRPTKLQFNIHKVANRVTIQYLG